MKKWLYLLLTGVLLLSFTACGKRPAASNNTTQQTPDTTDEVPSADYVEDVDFTPILSSQDYFETVMYCPPQKAGNIHYLFHEPIRETGKAYPLIIFLHGKGDSVTESTLGTSGPLVRNLINLENESEEFSTYTLVPCTPLASEGWWEDWQVNHLKELILHLVDTYNIDPKRIYVTGISMGGYTTCRLVNEMPPDTFAAAVPLSGAYDLIKPDAFYNTAFRIYHPANDTVVDVSCSRSLYQQLTLYKHPKAEYIEFAHGNHISPLYEVYMDQSFYDWLFAQRLP